MVSSAKIGKSSLLPSRIGCAGGVLINRHALFSNASSFAPHCVVPNGAPSQ